METRLKTRKIYRWHDGVKERRSDPVVLSRRLHEALETFGVDLGKARANVVVASALTPESTPLINAEQHRKDMLNALRSTGDVAKVARYVFDMPAFVDDESESGWTEEEAIHQMNLFTDWEEQVMGEAAGSQTSSPNTELRADDSPIVNGTDSNSTSTASASDEQPK
jgi:hypothetical protein